MGTVVVIGGGSAGAPAARSLRKKLDAGHRVILIEKEERVINSAALPLYAVGKRKRRHFTRSSSLLNRHGVDLIAGEVRRIDTAAKKVYTSTEETGYDLLLIAAGAVLDRTAPPGMAESGIDMQTPGGAEEICRALLRFKGGEIAIVVASTRIKCPAGPYEYALLIEDWFRRRERSRETGITIYTPERAPLILYGKRTSDTAAGLLLNRNIRVHPEARIRRVDPDAKKIILDRDSFPFDLLLYYAGVAPPTFVRQSGLDGDDGWVRADRHSMALPQEDSVFAVGDVTEVLTPSGPPLPKMGAVAHLQSVVAAANMACLMKGEKPGSAYNGFSG